MKTRNNWKKLFVLNGYLPVVILMLCVLIQHSCTNMLSSTAPGSGTGVGNGTVVVGKVLYPDSTAVKNATVRLRTQTYLADTSGKPVKIQNDTIATLKTDKNGEFRIDSIKSGHSYTVEVNDYDNSTMGTLYKLSLNQTSPDTVKLETRTLQPDIKINGTIVLSGLPQNAYIQIYGLERLGRTDSLGKFEFSDLPVGRCEDNECEYKLRAFALLKDGSYKSTDYELELKSDTTGNVVHVDLELED
jgi:hypothetical protein